jgi:uncharacterized membrane protein YecN with MAPEG domain
MLHLPCTRLFGGLAGLFGIALSLGVIHLRATKGIGMGDGGNALLARRIRGHANFVENTPLTLLLLAVCEATEACPSWGLYALGGLFLSGRLAHGYAFWNEKPFMLGRIFGIGSTFTVQSFLSVFCLGGGANATTVTIASVASTTIGITRAFMKKESP